MILDQLYPTVTTWGVGTTTDQYIDGHTAELQQLGTVSVDSYFLGWAEYDDLPTFMGHSTGSLDGDILTITEDVNESRVPCGYTFVGQYSTVDYLRGIFLIDGVRTGASWAYLINQVHPEYYASMAGQYTGGYIAMYFLVVLYDAGNNVVNRNGYKIQYDNYSTFFPFIHGDNSIYANITLYDDVQGITVNYGDFELSADMFAAGTEMVDMLDPDTHAANGYTARLFMVGYSMPVVYYRDNGGTTSRVHATFFAKMSAGEHEYCINAAGNVGNDWNLGWYTHTIGYIDSANNYTHYENSAGVSGTLNLSQIRGNEGAFTWDGGVMAVCGSWREGYPINVFALCSLEDVRKSLDSNFKVCPGTYVDSYVINQSYATDVTEQDRFLLQLKTGNITDPAFKNSLREWQYTDFQADDFTEEDIPGPKPPRPAPEPPDREDENSGDDITLPSIDGLGGSFGFTTQYALNGSQLQELGQLLWAGFSSTNPDIDAYLQNFVYRVDLNTGSVNMSDIMEFFISLRAYPLPLGNLTTVSAAGNDFYIGSGANPLTFTSTLHTSDCYLAEIDAGSVSIPFWFGDYRDYACEITLYLPYCGTAELNAGDVMGGTLDATYVVDLSTGSCTAYVMLTTWDGKQFPVAILPGQLGVDIPITASNAGRVGARLLGDRINVAENLLSVAKSGITGIGAMMSGNYAGALRSGVQAFLDPAINEQRLLAGMGERGAIAAPMLSGGRGLAAFKNPATAYVQIRSPYYAVPDNFADAVGDPAAVAVRIGDCTGFNQFYNVDVSGITTDAGDQMAIRQALESGIII